MNSANDDHRHPEEGLAPQSDKVVPTSEASRWCFQCASEYVAGTETCPECGVGLVDYAPIAAAAVGSEDEEQMIYELHEWAFESRRMLDQILTGDGVEHAWQGAELIIRDADEARVDAVIEAVERTTLPSLDEDAPKEVYEMAGWEAEQQSDLSAKLGLAGIPHEFNQEGDLVVLVSDEEATEAVFDEVLDEIDSSGEDESDLELLEGLDANLLMSSVFDAASRIAKDARDYRGVLELTEHGGRMRQCKRPFGFDKATWRGITDLVATIQDEIEVDGDDVLIAETAATLRNQLHKLI